MTELTPRTEIVPDIDQVRIRRLPDDPHPRRGRTARYELAVDGGPQRVVTTRPESQVLRWTGVHHPADLHRFVEVADAGWAGGTGPWRDFLGREAEVPPAATEVEIDEAVPAEGATPLPVRVLAAVGVLVGVVGVVVLLARSGLPAPVVRTASIVLVAVVVLGPLQRRAARFRARRLAARLVRSLDEVAEQVPAARRQARVARALLSQGRHREGAAAVRALVADHRADHDRSTPSGALLRRSDRAARALAGLARPGVTGQPQSSDARPGPSGAAPSGANRPRSSRSGSGRSGRTRRPSRRDQRAARLLDLVIIGGFGVGCVLYPVHRGASLQTALLLAAGAAVLGALVGLAPRWAAVTLVVLQVGGALAAVVLVDGRLGPPVFGGVGLGALACLEARKRLRERRGDGDAVPLGPS